MKSHIAIAFLLAVIGTASSQSAGRCDPNVCRLPRCYCGGTEVCKMMCSNLDTFQLLSLVETRVSNGKGQCNFSGQRDRSSFIVLGQRDNGTSQKSCQGTGRAGTAKIWDGTGRDSQNPGRDTGQNRTEQKRTF